MEAGAGGDSCRVKRPRATSVNHSSFSSSGCEWNCICTQSSLSTAAAKSKQRGAGRGAGAAPMGSEGQGGLRNGVVQGESSDVVWLQPPVPGHSWARQHTLVRSVHSEGWLVVLPALPQAGASPAGASRSLHFLHQLPQRQPWLMGPQSHRLQPATGVWDCVGGGIASQQCPALASPPGAGAAFPARPCSPACGAVSWTATIPLGRVHGRWMCIA